MSYLKIYELPEAILSPDLCRSISAYFIQRVQ